MSAKTKPTNDELLNIAMELASAGEDTTGVCMNCGGTQDGVEPDARAYCCECCGQNKVYGAEEVIIMLA